MKPYLLLLLMALGAQQAAGQTSAKLPRSAAQIPPAGLLVISHVNVVDVAGEYIQYDRMVVVRDGCIESIGKRAPAGRAVQHLDGRGKYLIPGLWDARVQALNTEAEERVALPLYLASGITSIRDESIARPRSVLQATARAVEAGTQIGPRIELAGPAIDGVASLGANFRQATTQTEGEEQTKGLLHEGWRALQTGPMLSQEAYLGVTGVAHTWKVPIVGCIPEGVMALEAAPRQRGIVGTEKLLLGCSSREEELVAARTQYLTSSQPATVLQAHIQTQQSAIVASFSPNRCTTLGQALAQARTFVIPTLGANPELLRYRTPDDSSGLRFVPAAVRQRWAQLAPRPKQTQSVNKKVAVPEVESLRRRMVAEFQRLGVPIVAGSGASWAMPYSIHGTSLLDELSYLVAAGLTPAQALQSATILPAIATGHRYDLGQIAPDFHGDLVLLDANPLDNINNLRRVRAVVLRGRVLNAATLAELLEEAKNAVQGSNAESAATTAR
jgi:hypothetical protein